MTPPDLILALTILAFGVALGMGLARGLRRVPYPPPYVGPLPRDVAEDWSSTEDAAYDRPIRTVDNVKDYDG